MNDDGLEGRAKANWEEGGPQIQVRVGLGLGLGQGLGQGLGRDPGPSLQISRVSASWVS